MEGQKLTREFELANAVISIPPVQEKPSGHALPSFDHDRCEYNLIEAAQN
jgi:hypothetical protein